MTAKAHMTWVQELLASRGLIVLMDDKGDGVLVFSANSKSLALPFSDMYTRTVADLADQLQAELS